MSSRHIIHGATHNLPDVAAFIEILSTLEQSPTPEARHLFETERELFVARAPGRLDVMGGIADYSGSLVLELPIQEATFVALQRAHQYRSPVSFSQHFSHSLLLLCVLFFAFRVA